jgi:hypothetical protein
MINKTALRVITRMLSIVIEQVYELSYAARTSEDGDDFVNAHSALKRAKQALDQMYDRN